MVQHTKMLPKKRFAGVLGMRIVPVRRADAEETANKNVYKVDS
jgi:hypothetical protein